MLILPDTPHTLPRELTLIPHNGAARLLAATTATNWEGVTHYFAELAQQGAPTTLVGASHTPAVYWLAALQLWPKANIWYWDAAAQQASWQQINATSVEETAPRQLPPAHDQRPQSTSASPFEQAGDSDHVLLGKGFRFAAWGLSDQSNLQRLKEVEYQVTLRANPVLSRTLANAIENGKTAFSLWQQCEQQLKEQGDSASFEAWYQALYHPQNRYVQRHLSEQLRKARNFKANKKIMHNAQLQHHSNVRGPNLEPHHPNSMAHLSQQSHWEVLIDETGNEFGDGVGKLAATDIKVGRMVALAVPVSDSAPLLPTIALGYHATEAGHDSNDKLVQNLLDANVGILGFSVKDQNLSKAYSWFSAVHTLCRWVLRNLPIIEAQAVKVDFLIEERGNSQQDLSAVSELLKAELVELDAARFAQLTINMRFIKKNQHAYNGYVDVVAHTWGSPVAASKDRLKKSGWLGHCLLRPDDETLSRLLLALEGISLNRNDWLALMSHASQLPEHSLAGNMLDKLGAQIQQAPDLWHSYVSEVSQQLDNKVYNLKQLVPALSWLQRYQPTDQILPPILELQWLSGKLAIANHQGQLDINTVQRCIVLCQQLKQEDARRVSEVLLRLSVSSTNSYQFALAKEVLQHLAEIPQLAMGLRNAGKLQSSLGQVAAFQGQTSEAQTYFKQAIACFSKLSDPRQAEQEQKQTQLYTLFVQLDDNQVTDEQVTHALSEYCQQYLSKDLPASLRSLAYGTSNEPSWLHHLLLRALCVRPALAFEFLLHYAEQAHQWQSGQHHPWPLINFYRGWLLQQLDQMSEAESYWQEAIEACQQGGTTLQWMGHVLAVAAQSLGSKVSALSPAAIAELQKKVPTLPVALVSQFSEINDVTHQDRVRFLEQCLPFNFH